MGKAFYDQCPESREIYKRAATYLGFDVAALCFEGPPDALTKTETCQPALFVTSIAAFAAFRARHPSVKPVGAAGLSLGELTALAVAEAFSFKDGVYLVQARANAMAECAARHPGAMLAVIGLSAGVIDEVCRESGVIAANLNAPEQVVLSGSAAGMAHAEGLAKARGAKRAVTLDVAGAFHSSLMQAAADEFRKALGQVSVNVPKFPVISNVTGEPMKAADDIPDLLVKQIVSPVRWEASVRRLIQMGATSCIEFPPARVLTGLLRRIDPSVKGVAIDDPSDFSKLSS